MTPTRTLGWRAAEAAIIGGFAYAVGFGAALALAVCVLALGVNAAEFVGERYGHSVAFRHVSLGFALVAFAGLAAVRGALWFPVVAAPLAAWFFLDAVAHAAGSGVGAANENGGDAALGEPDLVGELLRALRAEPREPGALAADLGRSPARVRRALDALEAAGVVAREGDGRYRVAGRAGRPDGGSLLTRFAARVREPLRLLSLLG